MTPFDLLSEPIRRYIHDKRWEKLRPIQAAAIEKIIHTDGNYILASRTASGKTEAAFLPILSKVDFKEPGVQVLYISPLIALINDQFNRVEELCKYLDVTITKWHGEASKGAKEAVLKQPNGIMLITPESIEAMFVNKSYNIQNLFSNLKYVVIDEIHSFIGNVRGVQLTSLLARMQIAIGRSFNVIGLSATIGDYKEAKKFTGDAAHTVVLLDKTKKDANVVFKYFPQETSELSLPLLKDLYLETSDNKALIFPNSRGRAEEVAVNLKKISARVKGHPYYFSHHSAVDKEVREYVEHFAKHNERQYFSIACTSTLELGIDIGSVDKVVQIDATHSIASLIQRIGRSGRKDGLTSSLSLYATDRWSLLVAIACWELYQAEYIEPPEQIGLPYDILLHQMLSIIKGTNGITPTELRSQLAKNFAFRDLPGADLAAILDHLITTNIVEKIGSELIIGVEGEFVVNSRDFYSVFVTEQNLKVVHAGNKIGEVAYSTQVKENENIFLAAKIWKIKYVDLEAKKVEVIPAHDGKKPLFFSSPSPVYRTIWEKVMDILYSTQQYPYLNEACEQELKDARHDFSFYKITDPVNERPLQVKPNDIRFYTFTGTKVNYAIALLLDMNGIKNELDDACSAFDISADIFKRPELGNAITQGIDNYLTQLLTDRPGILSFSKFGSYLPLKYQLILLKAQYYDFEGAIQFLQTVKLVEGTADNILPIIKGTT